jgi:Tol biopolymer transport system component
MPRPAFRLSSALLAAVIVGWLAAPASAWPKPGRNERVAVSMNGGAPSAGSSYPAITPDARFVAFQSGAADIVPGDTNLDVDTFIRDRLTGTTERVSLSPTGAQPNAAAWDPSVSADGRFVAFRAEASNLVPLDTNLAPDVFVHDRQTRRTERVSVATGGGQGNGASIAAAISRDGRYVAFESAASNLVAGDTNGASDVFVHDRQTGTTERVSVGTGGAQAIGGSFRPSMAAEGRLVFFYSDASNLVGGDANGATDLFVHDRQTGTTQRVSVAPGGADSNGRTWPTARPAVSGDGRYVAFFSQASNLVPTDANGDTDAFVRDLQSGVTERVSVPWHGGEPDFGSASISLGISDDGRYVAFESVARLLPDDVNLMTEIYVVDRLTGQPERVSVTDEGWGPNNQSFAAVLDASGRYPAFATFATNLDDTPPPQAQFYVSLFVRDRGSETGIVRLSPTILDGAVDVEGAAVYAGQVIATADDAAGDAGAVGGTVGADLTGATLVYRPELGDLLGRVRVASLPRLTGASGSPGVVYTVRMDIAGVPHEVRAARIDPGAASTTPRLALYRCQGGCTEIGTLQGGIGTTGSEIRFSIPLGLVGAAEGTRIGAVTATTRLGLPAAPGPIMDDLALPATEIPARTIAVGYAPPGTPKGEVSFSTPASISDAAFHATLDVPPGAWDVWARACLGTTCGATPARVTR